LFVENERGFFILHRKALIVLRYPHHRISVANPVTQTYKNEYLSVIQPLSKKAIFYFTQKSALFILF
jgi:hypothetical protein